jgi:hypothetical protein
MGFVVCVCVLNTHRWCGDEDYSDDFSDDDDDAAMRQQKAEEEQRQVSPRSSVVPSSVVGRSADRQDTHTHTNARARASQPACLPACLLR